MNYILPILPFVLAGVGLWLMLPRGAARGRRVGEVLGLVALGMLAWRAPHFGGWLDQSVFGVMAITTIVACAAAISAKNPLYSALWFGLALLGTAGLFLLLGAQFLSVATITVYAGAILVTFLFVIMLAQPEGHAFYDRLSWEAYISAAAGAVLVGLLTSVIGHAVDDQRKADQVIDEEGWTDVPAIVGTSMGRIQYINALRKGKRPIERDDPSGGILAEEHVASFGRELVGKHLLSMQVAGALMLSALVGAVAFVAHDRQAKQRSVSPRSHGDAVKE